MKDYLAVVSLFRLPRNRNLILLLVTGIYELSNASSDVSLEVFRLKHSTLLCPKLHCTIVTYTDVDGDMITISTHCELNEVFEQFMNHLLNTDATLIVLRVQILFF